MWAIKIWICRDSLVVRIDQHCFARWCLSALYSPTSTKRFRPLARIVHLVSNWTSPQTIMNYLPEPAISLGRTRGGNAAFHNFNNDYSHITDANLRRRLALSEVDKIPFGWASSLVPYTISIHLLTWEVVSCSGSCRSWHWFLYGLVWYFRH